MSFEIRHFKAIDINSRSTYSLLTLPLPKPAFSEGGSNAEARNICVAPAWSQGYLSIHS
jgi:hypothetical protein